MIENNKRLKIAFFTSLNEDTKSFYFSKNVLPFLKEYCDIDIFSDDKDKKNFCEINVYYYLSAFLHDKEKQYDIFFYQVEDSKSTNFCRMHLALKQGIVLFHDYYVFAYPPQTILQTLINEHCDNVKRDLGKALFSIMTNKSLVNVAKKYTRNNIKTIYRNNISYIPYPLEDIDKLASPREKSAITNIVFEGSTKADSRYFVMLKSLKNLENFKLIWLAADDEIETAIKLCKENGITNYEVKKNSITNIDEALQNADIAICLMKFLQYHNVQLILNALKNNVFVITNEMQNLYNFTDDLCDIPRNYIARVKSGSDEEKKINLLIKAYKEGKVILDYKKLKDLYLVNFSSKYIANELYRLFVTILDNIKVYTADLKIRELKARDKVFKKACGKDCDYLSEVFKELDLI